MPEPLRELRVKSAFKEHREVKAAQGVKIAAKDLEKAIAGLNLLRADHPDEIEPLKAEIAEELKKTLQSFKLQERGVYVQASTLGSLEALLEFLRTSEIPVSLFALFLKGGKYAKMLTSFQLFEISYHYSINFVFVIRNSKIKLGLFILKPYSF